MTRRIPWIGLALIWATGASAQGPLAQPAALAGDWPQYRGPRQDGISPETLNPVWSTEGPTLVWKVPTLNGFSSFAVADGKAFTLVNRAGGDELREVCVALDAATGVELWAADITRAKYPSGAGEGDGPRSTPLVDDGKVYVYSVDVKLCCLDAATGKELWRVDVQKDHAGKVAYWGNSASPVVAGDRVLVAGGGPGQSILAINKRTGAVVWKTGDTRPDYNTPIVTTLQGERQAVFCLGFDMLGISVQDGRTLWRQAILWHEATSAQPIVYGDQIYCGSANLAGSGLFQILHEDGEFYGKQLWEKDSKDSPYMSTPVLWNGHLYGTFGAKSVPTSRSFKCIEFATGQVKWAHEGFGYSGGLIVVGDTLVVLSDLGELVLVEPKPDAYKELARFKVLEGKCWSTPAFSHGRLYLRSTQEGACFDLGTR